MERLEELLTEGLNNEQVTEKIAAGQVNGDAGVKTRSYGQIVRSNLLSLFNLVNVILLVCIIISGSLKNALFFLMVIWNFGIGVFQEIRAKKTIEKLSLISSPKAQVLRDGQLISIPSRDIVLGEIMKLSSGAQICCDCVILKGSCQVNESMLTGESEPVSKKEGDHLLSGSFVSQGSVFACAEHVGSDNYVNRITAAAGSMNKKESVIMHSVKAIVRVVTICIVPLAALLVWNNFFRLDLGFSSAMVKTVAAVSSMIPGGLVLLVSIVLAVSVVRLAVHNTLVQDLYSVEYLARVDTLLLDKTGTITDGRLSVEEILNVADDRENGDALSLLKIYADCTEDSNSTIEAVREYIGAERTADSTAGAAGSFAGGSEYLTDGSAVAAAGNFLCVPFSMKRVLTHG